MDMDISPKPVRPEMPLVLLCFEVKVENSRELRSKFVASI